MLKRYSASLTLLFLLVVSSMTAAYGHGLGTYKSLSATISDKQGFGGSIDKADVHRSGC